MDFGKKRHLSDATGCILKVLVKEIIMQPTITVYSSPSCGFCHMAMEYFKSKGLAFTEKDITSDEAAYTYVTKTVGQAVTPIITIDDAVIVGFDRPKIDAALQATPAKNDTSVDAAATDSDDSHSSGADK